MLKFKDENKDKNIQNIKAKLEMLEEKIDVLKSMEVGVNFTQSDRAFDLSLYSTFESKDDLKTYAIHPEHLKVLEIIRQVTIESKVVDYSI
jgi:hypothetical protein